MDEVWSEVTPPRCPGCKTRFPRLLTLKASNEWNFKLRLECPHCLYEMDWLFTADDISDGWVESLMLQQQERYGDHVGDFAAWEDDVETYADPDAGLQLEFPDADWW